MLYLIGFLLRTSNFVMRLLKYALDFLIPSCRGEDFCNELLELGRITSKTTSSMLR